MTTQIITANSLNAGDVVYLDAQHKWTTKLSDSLLLEDDQEADELLAKVSARAEELVVVGPYLMEIDITNNTFVPLSQREIIRAKGPTIHPQFAKAENV